jgi:hypothetical protein
VKIKGEELMTWIRAIVSDPRDQRLLYAYILGVEMESYADGYHQGRAKLAMEDHGARNSK